MSDWAPKLEWKFETQTNEDLDRYYRFWGDEYRWTALLPIAWKSFEVKGFGIKLGEQTSDDFPEDSRGMALWSMAIHMLVLGMGWSDVALGLKRWRENRYALERHPILDFLFHTFGTNIGALEVYFANNQRLQLMEAADRLVDYSILDELDPRIHEKKLLISNHSFDGWTFEPDLADEDMFFDVVNPLLDVGDRFHLEPHVCGSISPYEIDENKPWVRQVGDLPEYKFQVNEYAGWGLRLLGCTDFRQLGDDGSKIDPEIRVSINEIGEIGTFLLNKSTGRYFLFSETYGVPSLQWDAHMWGN